MKNSAGQKKSESTEARERRITIVEYPAGQGDLLLEISEGLNRPGLEMKLQGMSSTGDNTNTTSESSFTKIPSSVDPDPALSSDAEITELGRKFTVALEGWTYSCKLCRTHLALADDIITRIAVDHESQKYKEGKFVLERAKILDGLDSKFDMNTEPSISTAEDA
ncbi:hypothetical protein ACH5RR_028102 [Cinchona calisaya]|uniref:Uncharacterized protein n=1 Tax=Cinchona calisaya TaxID=153742 RepID=A0ABD2YMS2_9GENT